MYSDSSATVVLLVVSQGLTSLLWHKDSWQVIFSTQLSMRSVYCKVYCQIYSALCQLNRSNDSTKMTLRPGSQYLASRPEVNANAWANARIELGSILAFAHAFTLTSGRDARYCEPGLSNSQFITAQLDIKRDKWAIIHPDVM